MNTRLLSLLPLFLAASPLFAAPAIPATAPSLPHLEKRGAGTQLIVDGKPFLVLGGEVHNSTTSNLDYLRPIWPKLAADRLNTVLVPVSWELVEPTEGKFDFSLVDGMLASARDNKLHLILLWMGSWKNSTSRYAADWVKADQDRFPRVQNADGQSLEILSAFTPATRDADSRAFAALMKHVREQDSTQHTVIMIQMQNEVGVLGASRDHSPAANTAFAQPVPKELLDYLTQHKDILRPELRQVWDAAGNPTSGTWTQVFGSGNSTDRIFMAWNYAQFMGRVTAAGKAEYALPVFVNTWIVQPEDKAPGDYPSGGPIADVHDIWRAGAPAIDVLCPDIYLPNFPEILDQYRRSGNPVFIPESRAGAGGAANAFYAIGQAGAIGYSPFGIEDVQQGSFNYSGASSPRGSFSSSTSGGSSIESTGGDPIVRTYALLSKIAPLVLAHQADQSIAGVWLTAKQSTQTVSLGNYTLNFSIRINRRATAADAPTAGYALVLNLGPDEYLVAGTDVQVTFTPHPPGAPIAGLLSVEEGDYVDGQWVPGRRLNGDEVQLRYDLSAAAAEGQSGAGLRFNANGPTFQKVKLYRYR